MRKILEGLLHLNEGGEMDFGREGDQYRLIVPVESRQFQSLSPRLNDTDNWVPGDVFYLSSGILDSDGFYWITLVKDKAMLGKSTASHDKGTITVTPTRPEYFLRAFELVKEGDNG